MTIFFAFLIAAFFIAAFFIAKKLIEDRGLMDPDPIDIEDLRDPDYDAQEASVTDQTRRVQKKTTKPIDLNETQVMGRYSVAVFRPDGSFYKEVNIPDNPSPYFSIGGAKDDNLIIPDRRVSRGHVLIGSDKDGLFLRDNDSTNGVRTKLGGPLVKDDIDIADNLALYLGPVLIKFRDNYMKDHHPVLVRRNKSSDNKTKVYTG